MKTYSKPTPAPPQGTTAAPAQTPFVERRRVTRALPQPEVVETDDEAAWTLWEDSLAQADTVPVPLAPAAATPDFVDPFATVGKKSG